MLKYSEPEYANKHTCKCQASPCCLGADTAGMDYSFIMTQKGDVPIVSSRSHFQQQVFSLHSDGICVVLIYVDFYTFETFGPLWDCWLSLCSKNLTGLRLLLPGTSFSVRSTHSTSTAVAAVPLLTPSSPFPPIRPRYLLYSIYDRVVSSALTTWIF